MSAVPTNEKSFSLSEWYGKYKAVIFYSSLVIVVGISSLLGYEIAGTGIIEKISDVSKSVCNELKSILDLQDVWVERFLVVLPPIFLIFSYNFHMVGKKSLLTKIGKAGLGFIPVFMTGAFYTFLFATSGIGLGVSGYGVVHFAPAFWFFVVFSALITALAIFIRNMTNDDFKDKKVRESVKKRKRVLTTVSLFIALIIYLYSSLYIPYKTFKEYGAVYDNAAACFILSK
ncbi:hypothetical protein EU508_00115 [Pseudoalteromonas fuliginea]|uniref:Uncharacterized protein n=1 Tax=Pseudoalteromonas fuliginea TaxID=1872678 RepID=A0AB73BM68_9GAMM|nr:hypothetical protein [Pseudoalteromonas fuliginea]KAA1166175.1 hypothetical protein EU508_00115 [Pseudoalteromonas fuliginea]